MPSRRQRVERASPPVGKDGREVWIQASYNPILDLNGKPFKIVKFATDVTEEKLAAADFEGQIAAIGLSTGIVEFDLDGTIRSANQNFLDFMGYRLEEVRGRHHSMFVEPATRDSAEYREFWARLNRGAFRRIIQFHCTAVARAGNGTFEIRPGRQ